MDGMKGRMHKEIYKELFLYLATVLGVILIWYVVLHVWRADWNIPFDYGTELGTDVFGVSTWLKSYIENGFSWKQTGISAPFFADRTGFGVDRIVLLMEIVSAHMFPTYGGALNFLYMLSFILTGITTVYTLRNLKFSELPSFAGAMIYTFLQYHLMRGEMHIYISFYYMVPLTVLIMLWLVDEKLLAERFSQHIYGGIRYAYIVFVLFSLLLGVGNPYYSFFAAMGIVFAVLYSMIHKHFKKMTEGIGYLLVIAVTTLMANLKILFSVSDVAMRYMEQQRTVRSIEFYGLKIINLLLPIQGHRLPILEKLRQYYDDLVEAEQNEGAWISLGFILAVCFCIALINYLVHDNAERRIRVCGNFILVFVLVSTIGGISSFIGLFFSFLRCYNRMVVFIAMFCVIVFAVLVEKLENFLARKKISHNVYAGLVMLLVVFAVWDQTTPANVYAYETTKEEYLRDERFVREIESLVPEGSCIFELPLLPTGTTSIQNLRDYELYKPYLHATSTRWLHMYAVGSLTDQWVNMLHPLPLRTVMDIIVCCGFQGVYLDSGGYAPDEWAEVLTVMDSIEGTVIIRSDDGRKAFYSLTGYAEALKDRLGSEKMRQYADFWLSCPNITCFPASGLHYTDGAFRQGDGVIVPPGCIQYGPYVSIQPGDYIVYVLGDNLNAMEYDLSHENGTLQLPIRFLGGEDNLVKYTFHVDSEIYGAEMRSTNIAEDNSFISGILLFNTDQADEISMVEEFLRIYQ